MTRARMIASGTLVIVAVALLLVTDYVYAKGPPPGDKLSATSVQAALDAAYAQFKDLKEGANADYIPALAKVDPNIYGIALVTVDGFVYTKGEVTSEVSIQSISKVF